VLDPQHNPSPKASTLSKLKLRVHLSGVITQEFHHQKIRGKGDRVTQGGISEKRRRLCRLYAKKSPRTRGMKESAWPRSRVESGSGKLSKSARHRRAGGSIWDS